MNKRVLITSLVGLLCLFAMCGVAPVQVEAQFITADTYTRYELLAPETHQFKIYYEVTGDARARAFTSIRSAKAAKRRMSR